VREERNKGVTRAAAKSHTYTFCILYVLYTCDKKHANAERKEGTMPNMRKRKNNPPPHPSKPRHPRNSVESGEREREEEGKKREKKRALNFPMAQLRYKRPALQPMFAIMCSNTAVSGSSSKQGSVRCRAGHGPFCEINSITLLDNNCGAIVLF
jgi:hypothetical protein